MRRIAGANTIELSPGKLGFRGRDTGAGVPGTVLTADWHNDVQEEICAVVEAAGLAPAADRTQMLQAIRALVGIPYAVDSGAANALVVNVNRPGWSLAAGSAIRVKVAAANVDTATVNVRNGAADLGTFALVRPDGSALCPYDLRAGQIVELVYDGANVQIPRIEGRTGDMLLRLAGTALTGHVTLNGLSIGKPGSGATLRANDDARQLYVHLYDGFPDAICPVATGRGINAAADWAAGKPIATLNTLCRTLVGVDGMGGAALANLLAGVPFSAGTAATLGARGGEALHALLGGELPPHPHGWSGSSNTGDDTPDHTHPYYKTGILNSTADIGGGAALNYAGNDGTPTGGASNKHHHPFSLSGNTDNGPGASTPHNNMPLFMTVAIFARL